MKLHSRQREESTLTRPPSRRELLADVSAETARHAAAAVRLSIALAQQLGMPLADVQCLGLLAAGPSLPSDLAARLGLTTGATTKVLDRLQEAGYITRSADPADRRRIVITADPEGSAALAVSYAPLRERMSDELAGYTTGDLAAIVRFLRAGRQLADEETAHIRGQGIRHATRRARGQSATAATT
jgi:DNA-binding MarR family transcriptional regulator